LSAPAAGEVDAEVPEEKIVAKAPQTYEEAKAELARRAPVPLTGIMATGRWGAPLDKGEDVVNIPIKKIVENKYQTRTYLDEGELEKLTASVRTHGVLQPVVVREVENGRYMLIMGSRRWRAADKAGYQTVPAIVRRVSAMQAAEMTVIENLQRDDISCLDEARAFVRLSSEFGQTQEQIGERMGMARETVSNYMRLLRLPREVQFLIDKKDLEYSHARQLLRIHNPELQIKVAKKVVEKKMSVEHLNAILDRWSKDREEGKIAPKSKARYVDPNVQAAQRELERVLGVKVKIRDRKGKGKITLEYSSLDEFDRIVGAMRGKRKN
jgi:ParB family chromosome partitioning protein